MIGRALALGFDFDRRFRFPIRRGMSALDRK